MSWFISLFRKSKKTIKRDSISQLVSVLGAAGRVKLLSAIGLSNIDVQDPEAVSKLLQDFVDRNTHD